MSYLKAKEDALSNEFEIGFKSAYENLKNASFRLVESVLTNLALKGTLEAVQHRNIEKFAHFLYFINVFARRALTSKHFVRPVAKFIREKVSEKSGKVEEAKKIAEDQFSLCLSILSFAETAAEFEKRIHGTRNQDAKVKERKKRKRKH